MSDTYTCDACGKPHPVGMHCNHYVKAISDRHDAEVDRLCQERDGHCEAEVAADAELTTLRAQVAGLEERVRMLKGTLEQIASPDAKGVAFTTLVNNERMVVAEWSMVQWRMDAAASAVKEPA